VSKTAGIRDTLDDAENHRPHCIDIMIWFVPIAIRTKKPGPSRLFEPISQSQKTPKHGLASCAGSAISVLAKYIAGVRKRAKQND